MPYEASGSEAGTAQRDRKVRCHRAPTPSSPQRCRLAGAAAAAPPRRRRAARASPSHAPPLRACPCSRTLLHAHTRTHPLFLRAPGSGVSPSCASWCAPQLTAGCVAHTHTHETTRPTAATVPCVNMHSMPPSSARSLCVCLAPRRPLWRLLAGLCAWRWCAACGCACAACGCACAHACAL